jgi:8-oxo-dGDP phosphatase
VASDAVRTRWKIHSDRLVDENPHIRLSIASVELPDGTRFDQYVMRMRKCAMTVVLDDAGTRVLLVWRHRFIIDRWVWELPGGYVDQAEDGAAAAAREVEEETGYRPRSVEYVMTFQPIIGSADSEQEIYLARGADLVGKPDRNEIEAIQWFPLDNAPAMIADGQIAGAATIIGVQHALLSALRSAQ